MRSSASAPDLIELRNLVTVADLIVRSAKARRESRGLHFTLDHRETSAFPRDTVLHPPGWEHGHETITLGGRAGADGREHARVG